MKSVHGRKQCGNLCKTTHCEAGWLVTLHPQGRVLEQEIGWKAAATLILRRSRPDAPLPNFLASNEAALAFIEARAAEEVNKPKNG